MLYFQTMCQVFYKLTDAINSISDEEVIFAKEVERPGKRIFVTCTKV